MANRYWIGDSGNWSDTSNWSTSSGGSSGASAPTSADDAIFDANSFSAGGHTVTLTANTNCRSLDSSAATNSATFATGIYTLDVHGADSTTVELDFSGFGSITSSSGHIYLNGGASLLRTYNLTTGGNQLPSGLRGRGGDEHIGVELQDALDVNESIILTLLGSSSTFNTNNHDVTVGSDLGLSSLITVDLGTSTINGGTSSVDFDYDSDNANNLTAINSTINCGSGDTAEYLWLSNGHVLGTVNITDDFSVISTGTNITITDLTISANTVVEFDNNSTVSINNSFTATGSAGNLITLRSDSATNQVTIDMVPDKFFIGDYLHLTDTNVTGGSGWYAGANSTDNSNNTGWSFTTPQELDPTLFTSGDTFYAPQVDLNLVVSRFDNSLTSYQHTIGIPPITVTASLFTADNTFYDLDGRLAYTPLDESEVEAFVVVE